MQHAGNATEAMQVPNETTRLEQLKSALIGPASTLYAAQKVASDQVRAQTEAAFGHMVDAHLLVSGVLGGVLLRTNGKLTQDGLLNQERRVLFASYVVGMPLCELAIQEGRYLQALTLLRHEMETLAQIVTSHSGQRKKGKVANVAVLGKDISRVYGDLSAAAHASNHDMASELLTKIVDETEDRISRGTYFYPVQNMKLARQAFALHLMLTINLITQVAIDYNKAHPEDGFGPLDLEALNLAMELLKKEGLAEEVPVVDTRGKP
jgi:hypothetical protein